MPGDLNAAADAAEIALAGIAPTGAPDADAGKPASVADTAAPQTTSPSSPSIAGTPAAAPAVPAEEPKFEIKVNGKTELLTRTELIARAQKETSYTQKSQQLAEEKRRFDADRQTILEQEKSRWLQELKTQQAQEVEAGKTPAELALARTQQLEHKLEDMALSSSVDSVISKHSGVDRSDFMMECVKRGLRDSKDVADYGEAIAAEMEAKRNSSFDSRFNEIITKGDHPTLKQYKEQVIAEYLKSKAAGPAPVTSAVGSTPALGGPAKKARTLDEASDMAMEMLGAKLT